MTARSTWLNSSAVARVTDQPSLAGAPALAEPAQRGRLDIAERAVERIATQVASQVSGVADVGSTLERAVGRQYPKASAQVAGDRATLDLEIAVAWPAPLAGVTGTVREQVRSRLYELAGLHLDAVNVVAAKVVHMDTET